jgi:hypothetical protein
MMKHILFVCVVVMVMVGFPNDIWAQGCAICTNTANQLGEDAAKGLNKGILYLCVLPVTMILIVFTIWFKKYKKQQHD